MYMSDSSAGSSSSEEEVLIEDILKRIGLHRKYGKLFSRSKICDLEDALELSEKKLKKLGVASSSHRKKILSAISDAADSDSSSGFSSSDSEEEELTEVEDLLEKNGFFKYKKLIRYLERKEIEDLKDLRGFSISDSKLKSLSVTSSRHREKILTLLNPKAKSKKRRKRNSGSSKSSVSSKGSIKEKKVIKEILEAEGFVEAAATLSRNGVKTLKEARNLTPEKLKRFGIDSVSERSAILSAFSNSPNAQEILKKHNLIESASVTSESDSEAEDNALRKALDRVHLGRMFHYFKKRGIHNQSVRSLQNLGHEELKDLGISNKGQRDLIIEAIGEADWQCPHCEAWNEQRKICMICHKVFRKNESKHAAEAKFSVGDRVKYTGRFRQTTKLRNGDKGKIERVVGNEFYMVKFENKKLKKVINIRLSQAELSSC